MSTPTNLGVDFLSSPTAEIGFNVKSYSLDVLSTNEVVRATSTGNFVQLIYADGKEETFLID